MPHDVLTLVASCLGPEEACTRMSCVSKDWRGTLRSCDGLWSAFTADAASQHLGPYQPADHDEQTERHSPPWRGLGPYFVRGVTNLNDSEFDGSCYELWRRYARAEDEHRSGVLPFRTAAADVADRISKCRSSPTMLLSTQWILPVVLWVLAIAQTLLVANALESASSGVRYALPAALAECVLAIWWCLTEYPFAVRRLAERHFQRHLAKRRVPQRWFYEHVAPPTTHGNKRWRRRVRMNRFDGEHEARRLLAKLESSAMIALSVILAFRNEPLSLWIVVAPASFGFLRYAAVGVRCTHREDGEWQCPLTRAALGCVAAVVLLGGVPLVGNGWGAGSALPLLSPYLVACSLLWLEATLQLHLPCLANCTFPWEGGTWLRAIGLLALCITGIALLLRVETILYPATTPFIWPPNLSWAAILAPLAINFAVLAVSSLPPN